MGHVQGKPSGFATVSEGTLPGPAGGWNDGDSDWGGEGHVGTTLVLVPYLVAHAWKLPFNLNGTFHGHSVIFAPSRLYLIGIEC